MYTCIVYTSLFVYIYKREKQRYVYTLRCILLHIVRAIGPGVHHNRLHRGLYIIIYSANVPVACMVYMTYVYIILSRRIRFSHFFFPSLFIADMILAAS